MIKIDYWENFKQTGKIDDYLAFKSMTGQFQTDREIIDADNNGRNSNS